MKSSYVFLFLPLFLFGCKSSEKPMMELEKNIGLDQLYALNLPESTQSKIVEIVLKCPKKTGKKQTFTNHEIKLVSFDILNLGNTDDLKVFTNQDGYIFQQDGMVLKNFHIPDESQFISSVKPLNKCPADALMCNMGYIEYKMKGNEKYVFKKIIAYTHRIEDRNEHWNWKAFFKAKDVLRRLYFNSNYNDLEWRS